MRKAKACCRRVLWEISHPGHDVQRLSSGDYLIVGNTTNPEFSITNGAFDRTYHGGTSKWREEGGDIYITQLSADLKTVAFANFLLDHGADVNVRNHWGQTPLHSANGAYCQDYELIKRLITQGADVNAQGSRGDSPLSWAATRGNLKVVRLPIDSGADLDACDTAFGTILHGVTRQNCTETAKLLIESGAKLNQTDPSDRTELHLAAISG